MAPNLPPQNPPTPLFPRIAPPGRRANWLGKRQADRAGSNDLQAGLVGLRQFFDAARSQFDENELNIAEWRLTRDAFERAYDAFTTHATETNIETLCNLARRTIDMAVEMSTARGYYDSQI